MSSLISLTVNIADRQFYIKVEPENEATVRQTIDLINEKILEFKKQMPGFDMQHYISLAFMWFATQPSKQSIFNSELFYLQQEIEEIELTADKILETFE